MSKAGAPLSGIWPAAAVTQRDNYANRAKLDPETQCYLPGVPRATHMGLSFQIVQHAGRRCGPLQRSDLFDRVQRQMRRGLQRSPRQVLNVAVTLHVKEGR
jgi:hypothetical protein